MTTVSIMLREIIQPATARLLCRNVAYNENGDRYESSWGAQRGKVLVRECLIVTVSMNPNSAELHTWPGLQLKGCQHGISLKEYKLPNHNVPQLATTILNACQPDLHLSSCRRRVAEYHPVMLLPPII